MQEMQSRDWQTRSRTTRSLPTSHGRLASFAQLLFVTPPKWVTFSRRMLGQSPASERPQQCRSQSRWKCASVVRS